MVDKFNEIFDSVDLSKTEKNDANNIALDVKNDLQRARALRKTMTSKQPSTNSSNFFFRSTLGLNSTDTQANNLSSNISNNFLTSPLKFRVQNFAKLSSSELATTYIDGIIKKESDTPALSEVFTKYPVDNYNFKPDTGLGNFTRFEKFSVLNIPDKILLEYSTTKCITSMGMFPELKKCWLTVDNKLILWDYEEVNDAKYSTIDEFKHTILTVKLVKPKKGVFIDDVNYLLLISTPMDIYILAVEYDKITRKLEIYNTAMSVSTKGLVVNKFITFNKTNDIFFSGVGDNINVWKLNYTNKQAWFSNRCSKECLTRSGMSTVLPDSITNLGIFGSTNDSTEFSKHVTHEYLIQLEIDQLRGILYTLSSKSVIRAYKIDIDKNRNVSLPSEITKTKISLLKDLSTTNLNIRSPLLKVTDFHISKIFPVTKEKNCTLYLVAVLSNGVRIYINGTCYSGYGYGYDSKKSTLGRLSASFIKFPPPDFDFYAKSEEKRKLEEKQQMDQPLYEFGNIFMKDQKYQQQKHFHSPLDLKNAQENSNLLKNLKTARVISRNIYFGVLKSSEPSANATKKDGDTEQKGSTSGDRLFVSTPDYNLLKKDKSYVEDFEFLDTSGVIHDIIPLTVDNSESTSKFLKEPLTVAVLTNSGIHIYRYRTSDLILEDSLDEATFKEFSSKYGPEEACSSALHLACKYGKSDSFKIKATQFFIEGGHNGSINKNLTLKLGNVELSDRFFGFIMMIGRLFKNVWDTEVFKVNPEVVKFEKDGFINQKYLLKKMNKSEEQPIMGLTLSKQDLEYLLSSILIVLQFFKKNSKIIPGLSQPNFTIFDINNDKTLEIVSQAENISFKSVLKLLESMTEGLSFLMILLEQADSKEKFADIFKYLSIQSQIDLSCLMIQDFLAPRQDYIKILIKEILSAIINKNIAKGLSVEYITTSLQERCGTFCSSDDVIMYKAIENLKRAKELYTRDYEESRKYLVTAAQLFEKCNDKNLNMETIAHSIDVMNSLNFYQGSIKLLLNLANKDENANKISLKVYQQQELVQVNLQPNVNGNGNGKDIKNFNLNLIDPEEVQILDKKMAYYELVFKILTEMDEKAKKSLDSLQNVPSNFQVVTEFTRLRELLYEICFNHEDQIFHYELYKFFIKQGISERLLDVNSEYILTFLEDYASHDINIGYLLCDYHLRRSNYLQAANILVSIVIAFENLDNEIKIQLLCKAKVYLNAGGPNSASDKLSAAIEELIRSLVSDPNP
ncbi:hypothetical protein PACTADRAFT_49270 [Pachysolen tannophilus NRRL Y-2460]|uniref:Nucleoporin Nup133/Nup155-like N-terminal domain-containing protein n=1 Tax=Pachysolen tannophilus NRRL Y-2460 TaxID=669874 RepID=A0A1E4TVL2_PACTA|nr:hypothetical protein PACTADRAFT_49270 [Pachysolen tannophilus NRRL Y-2460]